MPQERFKPTCSYRLNVFPIEVPPLRKRKEDIPMLVEYFVKRTRRNGETNPQDRYNTLDGANRRHGREYPRVAKHIEKDR